MWWAFKRLCLGLPTFPILGWLCSVILYLHFRCFSRMATEQPVCLTLQNYASTSISSAHRCFQSNYPPGLVKLKQSPHLHRSNTHQNVPVLWVLCVVPGDGSDSKREHRSMLEKENVSVFHPKCRSSAAKNVWKAEIKPSFCLKCWCDLEPGMRWLAR